MTRLIITNGDIAADLLSEAGREGELLPWRDVLHEGPIIAGPVELCSEKRAGFLAERFRLDRAEIADTFAERDAVMRDHRRYDQIELWFEHDLYDQLQLIQILTILSEEGRHDDVLLVQADDYLGHQRPDTVLRFIEQARPVTSADLNLADAVWIDLAMPTPEAIAERLAAPFHDLPFLGPALHRFLEELPAPATGLGRTETTALGLIDEEQGSPVDLFRRALVREEAAFMGDLSFFGLLDDLAFCDVPLIAGLPAPANDPEGEADRLKDSVLTLTRMGQAALAGENDHASLNGIDRWWAGTRLAGRNPWRYDRDGLSVVRPSGIGGIEAP